MPTCHKKSKLRKDSAVQETNDSSVVSKVSASVYGYFQDDFQRRFVCKVLRRAPLINRGYYVRWKAVDDCIKWFLQITSSFNRRQILSLGAGFDSLYFRLHAEDVLKGVVIFEVDFPGVAQRKAALIGAEASLKEWIPHLSQQAGPVYLSNDQYRLMGLDIRQKKEMELVLTEAGFEWSCPTLVLSEVVLTYMETEESDRVIGWAAEVLQHSVFVMYEQIRPLDPFGRVMQKHFLKLNSALHALHIYPDVAAQRQRFLSRGWEECVCLDMNQFYLGLVNRKERDRVETLEPFDEFEEWHQKCSHYFILTASKGSLTITDHLSLPSGFLIPVMGPTHGPERAMVSVLPGKPSTEGLGMASALLEPQLLLLAGGFGRSGRDTTIRVLIQESSGHGWSWAKAETPSDWGARLYHTMTAVPGEGALIFGGRSSPVKPFGDVLRVTYDLRKPNDSSASPFSVTIAVQEMQCDGPYPQPRWRHTAALLQHSGNRLLFVFGGRTMDKAALGDTHFLDLEGKQWIEPSIEGTHPVGRHSHSCCAYQSGAVIFGGLGEDGAPLGDAVVLKPTSEGFCWKALNVQPPAIPRYSHTAHVIGHRLVVVGGVWINAENVPGLLVIDLGTGASVEYDLDMSSIPWPLMLHSFCSEMLDPERLKITLIGGGGNCFSFGTHLNPHPVTLDLTPVLSDTATSLVNQEP